MSFPGLAGLGRQVTVFVASTGQIAGWRAAFTGAVCFTITVTLALIALASGMPFAGTTLLVV